MNLDILDKEKKIINKEYTIRAFRSYTKLFNALDEDVPDRQSVASNRAWYKKHLLKTSPVKEIRDELQDLIEGYWCSDTPFLTILKEKGFVVSDSKGNKTNWDEESIQKMKAHNNNVSKRYNKKHGSELGVNTKLRIKEAKNEQK